MAVIEKINSIKQHIAAAYEAVNVKGGAIPKDKNCANLAGAISDISTGIDISDTTATAADVRVGKDFYAADGTKTIGTIADYNNSSEVVEGLSNTGVTLPETLVNGENAGAAVGNKIYLFNDKKTIQEFDTETKTIITLSNISSNATAGIGCATVGTKIYLLGGSVGFNQLNTIQEFNTETKTIQTLSATLSTAAENMACAAVGSKIYLFGGLGSQPLNAIQEFDTETKTIQTLSATLPSATYDIRAAAVGTKIYLFGGTTANTKLKSIKEFDTETKTMTTLSVTLPVATANMGCTVVGTKIYLFGGYSTKRLNTIQEFDTESKTLKTASIKLPVATTSIVAVTVGNKIYLISGYSDNGWVKTIYVFSPNGAVVDILVSDKNGVILNTKRRYCIEDITVKPALQVKIVNTNGDVLPSEGYCGLEKVTVNVPAMSTQEKTITITENGTQEVTPDSGKALSKVTVTTNVDSGLAIKGLVEQYTIQAGETISAGNFVEWITSIGDGTLAYSCVNAIMIDTQRAVLCCRKDSNYYYYIIKINSNAISFGTPITVYNGQKFAIVNNMLLIYCYSDTSEIRMYKITDISLTYITYKSFGSNNLPRYGSLSTFPAPNDFAIGYGYNTGTGGSFYNRIFKIDVSDTDFTVTTLLSYGSSYSTYSFVRAYKVDDTHYVLTSEDGGGDIYAYNSSVPSFEYVKQLNVSSAQIRAQLSDDLFVANTDSTIYTIKISGLSYTVKSIATGRVYTIIGVIDETHFVGAYQNRLYLYEINSDYTMTELSSIEYADNTSASVTSILNTSSGTISVFYTLNGLYYYKSIIRNGNTLNFPNAQYIKIVRAASNNIPVGIAAQDGVGGETINVYVPTQLWLSAPLISITGSILSWSAVQNAVNYGVYDNGTLISTQTTTTYDLSSLEFGEHSLTVKALATSNYDISPQSNVVAFNYAVYNVTTNLTNITANTSNPTTVSTVASSTLIFTANTGYNLPDNITVTGAEFTWTKSSGTLVLSNPTGDVSVTIAGIAISRTITATLTNVTAASGNATTIATGETKTLTYTAAEGYTLPDTVTVTGATGIWNKDSGTLTLSNPTADVTFTITGVMAASGGYTVTVNSSLFYNTGNLARINGVEQELDGQKTYTFNNVNTFNIYSSTAMSDITSGTGSIPTTYDWSSGWAWSTDIAITQDSSCVVSNDN